MSLSFSPFTAVDGARGIAILSVLLYHSGWSERGLFGVDMFFVVSGFLITLLLVKEAAHTGRIRILSFYGRRAKRLLPPLILSLAGTLLLVWSLGTLEELKAVGATALASLFQIANWYQIATSGGYWDSAGQIIPLGQMWSLSVTEQFYVVWPLAVALLWIAARRRPAVLAGLLAAAFLGTALVAPLLFDGTNSDRLYLGTDSRVVSFVAGGAIAALVAWVLAKAPSWSGPAPSRSARVLVTATSGISLTTVLAASIATSSYHEAWIYQGGLATVSLAIAIFIGSLCFPANALTGFFNWKPFRNVGVLSYAMFLLHLPVFWYLQQVAHSLLHPLILFLLGSVITWLVATVMHYVVTEPLRVRSWKPIGAAVSIVLSFGLVAGLAWALPLQRIANPQHPASTSNDDSGIFPVDPNFKLPAGEPVTVAVIGDSVAGNMHEALVEYGAGTVEPIDVTQGGCGILDADSARSSDGYVMDTQMYCWPWKDRLQAANLDHHPDVYILHNLWDKNDQLLGGEWVGPTDEAWQERYRAQLELLVSFGAELDTPPLILLSNDHPREPSGPLNEERLSVAHEIAADVAEAHENVLILDFEGATCPDGACRTTTAAGAAIYRDGSHLSAEGMALMAPWLENQIAKGLTP